MRQRAISRSPVHESTSHAHTTRHVLLSANFHPPTFLRSLARLDGYISHSRRKQRDKEGVMTKFSRVLIALVVSVCSVGAFMPSPAALAKSDQRALAASSHRSSAATTPTRRPSALRMGWGDALGKAFANEDMAPQKNPGLKSEPNTCMVSECGQRITRSLKQTTHADRVGTCTSTYVYVIVGRTHSALTRRSSAAMAACTCV